MGIEGLVVFIVFAVYVTALVMLNRKRALHLMQLENKSSLIHLNSNLLFPVTLFAVCLTMLVPLYYFELSAVNSKFQELAIHKGWLNVIIVAAYVTIPLSRVASYIVKRIYFYAYGYSVICTE
ncbi:hypothetical protein AGMMS49975_20940 [Clostridia bacterium]|nr:hypothetical protein AGMMS49975_20940 [Clostridia bacterium]